VTPNILVTGAAGTLGSAVVEQLAERGIAYAGAGRSAAPAHFFGDWHRLDLVSGGGVLEALQDRTGVVHCATNVANPELDLVVLRRLVEFARYRDLHIVFIGIAGIEAAARHLPYYRMKLACEQTLRESGVPHSIVRATQFHDFVSLLFGRLLSGPFLFLPRMTLQPVDVRHVASVVADTALGPPGRYAETCGPEVLDARTLARIWLAARRRSALRVPLPALGPFAAMAALTRSDGSTGGQSWQEWNRWHHRLPEIG